MRHPSDYISPAAMLEQTAEEANELAFACLKLARHFRGENKVRNRTEEDMVDNLAEEIADMMNCINEIHYLAASDNCPKSFEGITNKIGTYIYQKIERTDKGFENETPIHQKTAEQIKEAEDRVESTTY